MATALAGRARRAAIRTVLDGYKLGKNQRLFLSAMLEHGPYPGYGWCWTNRSSGERVAKSLEKKGLVRAEQIPVTDHRGKIFPAGHPLHGQTTVLFHAADAVKAAVREEFQKVKGEG